MSETVRKPVILDETAQLIVDVLKTIAVREGATREVLQEIHSVLQEKLPGGVPELFFIPFAVTITAPEANGTAKTASCTLDGITFAEVEKAHKDGKFLIADVFETTTKKKTYVPLSAVVDTDAMVDYFFEAMGKNNPMGRPFAVTIKNIKANNYQIFGCSMILVRSEDVICNVSINGTTYTTLAEALAALAGGAT